MLGSAPLARSAPLAKSAPLATPASPASLAPILRVGVLDGSPPCSNQLAEGRWEGQAVDLWRQVASRERLAFVLEPYPNAKALLEASRRDQVDVGVGCLTITPERVGRYRFSLPFQESGLAILMQANRLASLEALLRQLLKPQLAALLAGYLLAIALLSWLIWRGEQPCSRGLGRREQLRRYALLFQVLATGPGTNTIVTTTRGHGLVLLSYLIRIVSASLIVSTMTIDVLQQPPSPDGLPRSMAELAGRRVAARPGSVSEGLLQAPPLRGRVQLVALPTLAAAVPLLQQQRVDAVLADEQQLRYVRNRAPSWQRSKLRLVLDAERSESQAFVFSPQLAGATQQRIDRAISQAKREGLVSEP